MNDEVADCFICRKHRGDIPSHNHPVYEDDVLFASHAEIPDGAKEGYMGYLFLEPKRHVSGLAELTDAEAQELGLLTTRLSRVLKEVAGAEHVYAFVLGHHADHLHVHLVCRYPGAPREYWGVNVDEWPGAPRGDQAAIAALTTRLSTRLESGRS